jgi:riboflavin synthase
MFTGLVEEVGEVGEISQGDRSITLSILAKVVSIDAKLGDSIAINGVCLTAEQIDGNKLSFTAMDETLTRTNIGSLTTGDRVNLERPVVANGRLGGHIVQGHVDALGQITDISPQGDAIRITVEAPSSVLRYIVEKGSITIDGISLTVVDVLPTGFTVWIIPHTQTATNLGVRRVGDKVNLEVDILAKYVERLTQFRLETVGVE